MVYARFAGVKAPKPDKKRGRIRRASSSKGALIKGMSRGLPSEILQDPLFRKRLKEIMRGHAGIYALSRGRKLYYTGLTRDLFGRIRWHTRDRHAAPLGSFHHFSDTQSSLSRGHRNVVAEPPSHARQPGDRQGFERR